MLVRPMHWLRILIRLCLAAVFVATLTARPAAAEPRPAPSYAPVCHAASGLDQTAAAMLTRSAWTCSQAGFRADQPAAWLRFEASQWQGQPEPRLFISRIARFKTITLTAVDAGGAQRSRTLTEAATAPLAAGPVFQMPLPDITAATQAVLVRIEAPHSVPLLTEARLIRNADAADWSPVDMMLLAFVIGMLVLPVLFDISFFIVLRERFVVIHAAMVSVMMVYVLFAGGLISVFVTLPVALIAVVGPLAYAIGGGLSAVFLTEFLESGAQSRPMRRITLATGLFTMIVPGFFALQFHATQPFDDRAYFFTYMPAIIVLSLAITEAMLRGSRSARFIAVAWTPIIAASIERLMRGLGLHVGPSTLDQMLYIAVGFEVVVISLAIADRLLALRRERDAARTEARMLEKISTRDSLTGLMNRRAIEARFDELLAQGFDTFALVDLDRFKAINDLHGHQVGDAALVACGNALRVSGDRDSVAVRLGGEEFVVLLRGEHTLDRAEAMRQAIPLRIATDVPGLELPVTASMGVIVVPEAHRHAMAFSEFYARADALMYEAKASGRNRLAYERLTVFSAAPASYRQTRERDAA